MSLRRQLSRVARRLGLRPGPLDWRTGAESTKDRTPGAVETAVEIIVPIHGAHEVARDCLASVARHTDLGRHRLTVVVDGDPGFTDDDVRASLAVEREKTSPTCLKVLRHRTARGFVASANRGMAESDLDVVLLNSDVVVTERWLDKMLEAAASVHEKVATVTPFSNDATLCSVPEPLRPNELPAGHDVDSFASLVEGASKHTAPRLPTGVGMCLLIRRAALRELGLFDEDAFGRGYGEETDFCFRALRAGWIHLLDDATFVFHHGEQSFGPGRAERVRRAERVLARRHPDYVATLDAFLRRDLLGHGPAAEAVRRVRWALRREPRREPRRKSTRFRSGAGTVLHLVHGWPPHDRGGTENYCRWLVEDQLHHRDVAVYARRADASRSLGEATDESRSGPGGTLRTRLVVNNFAQRHPLSRNALHSRLLARDFGRFLDEMQPDLVHVHHLAGHGITLLREVERRGLPLVYQVQDWWAYCARANLLRRLPEGEGTPCSGPGLRRCSECLPLTGLPPAALLNRTLYALRSRLARGALRSPHAYVMGSRAIRDDYLAQGLLQPEDRIYVLPYGVETPPAGAVGPKGGAGSADRPIRLGCVGAVLPHKGLHVVVEALRGVDGVTLDLWGNDQADPAYTHRLRQRAPADRVRLRGRFDDEGKAEVFASLDVLLVPSLGKESFGLVAREALAHGVPVLASRHGALAELFDDGGEPAGALLPPGDVEAWRREIERLVDEPSRIDRWRAAIRPVVGLGEHAEAVEQVYADVLGGVSTDSGDVPEAPEAEA